MYIITYRYTNYIDTLAFSAEVQYFDAKIYISTHRHKDNYHNIKNL